MIRLNANGTPYSYFKEAIGEGAFGKIYRGKDSNNKEVAIKIIENLEENLENEYMKEVEIMKIIQYNTNDYEKKFFLHLFDSELNKSQKRLIIILEYCNQGDLEKFLTKNKELDERVAVRLIAQLVYALEILKKLNIAHRDLKPSNILVHITEDGNKQMKLIDFGCAIKIDPNSRGESIDFVGTPIYMSPQLLNREPYTDKSDIWSLGVLYYKMVFGRVPWPHAKTLDEYIKVIKEKKPIEFPRSINPITNKSKDFIERCLKYNEEERMDWDSLFRHELIKVEMERLHAMYRPEKEQSNIISNGKQNATNYKQEMKVSEDKQEMKVSEDKKVKLETNAFQEIEVSSLSNNEDMKQTLLDNKNIAIDIPNQYSKNTKENDDEKQDDDDEKQYVDEKQDNDENEPLNKDKNSSVSNIENEVKAPQLSQTIFSKTCMIIVLLVIIVILISIIFYLLIKR